MTWVEIIITEWTWVVSLYNRGVIGYYLFPMAEYCIYFSEDHSALTLIKCCIRRHFIRIICVLKILINESLEYKGLMLIPMAGVIVSRLSSNSVEEL